MKRPRSLNGFANAAFFFLLVVLVTSPFFSDRCLARRETHGRKPGDCHGLPQPVLTAPSHRPSPVPTTFSVLHYGAVGDGATDDTKAFVDTWSAACAVRASTVVVPASFRFLVGPVTFTGDSCQPDTVFQVDGTILANTGSTAWRSGGVLQWLEFTNVRGLTIQGSGTVDGQGSHWWGGAAGTKMVTQSSITFHPLNSCGEFAESDYCNAPKELYTDRVGTGNRPTAMRVYQGTNVAVIGITITNSPRFHLTFDGCRAVEVHGVTVSSPGDSPNTDGIHLARSVGVSIHHSTLACGDDCISIQDGCSEVLIRNVNCGPGHGISIGGLGKGGARAVVSDVTVQDVTLTQTMTGVRIKTWQGGSGWVKNVRFANVRVSAVKTPIVIDQYYCDHAACTNQTAAVAVSGIAYQGVTGTYTVQPVYLACSDGAPCSGIHLANIQLSSVKDRYHLYGPFCWKAYGDEVRPVQPPVDCLMTGVVKSYDFSRSFTTG